MKRKLLSIVLLLLITNSTAQNSYVLIDSLLQIGRYKKALKKMNILKPTFKSNVKIATIYESIDDYKNATLYYKKGLTYKDDYKTKVKLGRSLKKDKKLNEAVNVFKEIVKKDSENLVVKYQLGKLYLQLKKGKEAKQIFQDLVANDKKNANYSYRLGLANILLKERYKKIDNFLNAYRKDSTHINAIEMLARAYTKLRDKDSANLFINKGLVLSPNHINLNRLKINALYKRKKI